MSNEARTDNAANEAARARHPNIPTDSTWKHRRTGKLVVVRVYSRSGVDMVDLRAGDRGFQAAMTPAKFLLAWERVTLAAEGCDRCGAAVGAPHSDGCANALADR